MNWRCTFCGESHPENDPPCEECGHNAFEKVDSYEGEGKSAATSLDEADTGASYVWTCVDCGRDHVKNNPPCSRCGTTTLEKTEQTYDDISRDLNTAGWLGVIKPYTPVFGVAILVVALFATGIVTPSMVNSLVTPDPPDAPGEGTEAAGINLEDTEQLIHEGLEAERDGSRTYDEGLAAYAEYHNRAYVAIEYEDARVDAVSLNDFGIDCHGTLEKRQLPSTLSIANYDDEAALADVVVDLMRSDDAVTGSQYEGEGMDLHVVDGSIYLFYVTC